MTRLFPGPSATQHSTLLFTLPSLEEDAPGAERLLGTLGRVALGVPAFSLGSGGPTSLPPSFKPEDNVEAYEELGPLPELPDLSELHVGSSSGGVFPLLNVGVNASPPEAPDESLIMSPSAFNSAVNDWRAAAEPVAGPSRVQPLTWDADAARLLSECSPADFEAFLAASEPPLALPKLRTPVNAPPAPGRSVLDLLMRATLGTALSGTVRWSTRRGGVLVYSGTGARPAGLERRTADRVMGEFLTIGTGVRRLEMIMQTHSATPLTPTHHALFFTLSTILTYVRDRLAAGVEATFIEKDMTAPWLRRSSSLAGTRELVTALCDVMCWPMDAAKPFGLPARPASVLTHLHAHLVAHLSTETAEQQRGYVSLSLAYLLSHASQPFLDLLHQWIGLADDSRMEESLDPEEQPWADLGITRESLPPTEVQDVRWGYTFSARRMPAFVPRDVRRTLFEAGRSLRALREASKGQHPLCSTEWPIRASWGWGRATNESPNDVRSHARRVQREIDHWRGANGQLRSRTISATSLSSFHTKRRTVYTPTPPVTRPPSGPSSPAKMTAAEKDKDFWALFNLPPGSNLGSKTSSLWAPASEDELDAFVQRHSRTDEPLLPDDSPTLELYISTHLLAPLLAHASLISRALVSLYIDDLNFLDHLDVLRAFWLGGDAGFTERVGAALFGKDQAGVGEALGMGRRARTRARLGLETGDGDLPQGEWGVGLGLGLSDRNRWPPGGAELTYALRTALLDDEIANLCSRGTVWENLEDRVSFAVRSLPENDEHRRRARWLNPQAIEALDFLYLAYTPPTAIATLLPPSIMEKYQLVHNFLLRLSRIDAVLRLLYFTILRPPALGGPPVKTGVDAKYSKMPSQIGLPPRAQRGPFPSGSEAEKSTLFLRYEMSWFVSSLSRYVLDTAIGHNWDVMRRRLDRLRRRGAAVTGTDSRPMTPGAEYDDDYEDLDFEVDEAGGDAESEGTAQLGSLSQLQSAHSLVLYHNIILNRILRACLLSDKPGHQVTFKILMALLSLILDLAKTVTEVERGAVTFEDASAHVSTIRHDWTDKKAVFLHALERLALRTSWTQAALDRQAEKTDEEADLQLLLEGEGREDRNEPQHAAPGSAELQELLLRLKLGTAGARSARWAA